LVIGTTPVLSSSLLPQVCERLAAVEPEVQVVVRDLDRRAIQSGVEAGELDAGYGVFLDIASGVRRVPLLDVPMVAVRASGAADIRRSSVAMEWRDFTDLPLVGLPADNPVQRLVDAQLSASEVLPVERHEFENMHTQHARVRHRPPDVRHLRNGAGVPRVDLGLDVRPEPRRLTLP
jgi:DNA-binding transcriptional LysR family regulator